MTDEDGESMESFQRNREQGNEVVMRYAGLEIKRYYSLDSQAYRDGALRARTKELLGLVSSFVLRCDDCVRYHIRRCHEEGVSTEELVEALTVGLVVGGSITVPQLRMALSAWDELRSSEGD